MQDESTIDRIGSLVHCYPKRVCALSRSGGPHGQLPEPCGGSWKHQLDQNTITNSSKPRDIPRQSLPFSYITLSVASTDGDAHDVKIYTDISAEWVSGDNNLVVNWTTTVSDNIVTHQSQLLEQWPFSEINDRIQREFP